VDAALVGDDESETCRMSTWSTHTSGDAALGVSRGDTVCTDEEVGV
jgi:hypothetical protein